MIRAAVREDVPAILDIYSPYILTTAFTFEYVVPSLRAFEERFERISECYPWLVWEERGEILGYAYGSQAFERAAFSWDADLSIYLKEAARGQGIGRRLYGCLEKLLESGGYHNLYALITGANLSSVRFHERLGYEQIGLLPQTGFKLGRWWDLYWYGKRLRAADMPGEMPKAFVCDDAAWEIMKRYSE